MAVMARLEYIIIMIIIHIIKYMYDYTYKMCTVESRASVMDDQGAKI